MAVNQEEEIAKVSIQEQQQAEPKELVVKIPKVGDSTIRKKRA